MAIFAIFLQAATPGTRSRRSRWNGLVAALLVVGVLGGGFADAAVRALPGFTTNVLPANDDESTLLVPLGFTVNYFGLTFTGLYVNNNGNVTFDQPLSEFTPFDLTSTGLQIIAPFFADVDTTGFGSGLVTYGNDTVDGRPAFGVDWINVGYFDANVDKLNSFQLVLIDRSDVAPGDFDFEFNYDRILWETGDASDGIGGLGGSSARAGFSNGTGNPGTFFEIAGSAVNGAFLDGNAVTGLARVSNVGIPGRQLFRVRNGGITVCGDGQTEGAEECDDGNANSKDGCTTSCTVCGNEIITSPEECDDGNLIDGDGCEADCTRTPSSTTTTTSSTTTTSTSTSTSTTPPTTVPTTTTSSSTSTSTSSSTSTTTSSTSTSTSTVPTTTTSSSTSTSTSSSTSTTSSTSTSTSAAPPSTVPTTTTSSSTSTSTSSSTSTTSSTSTSTSTAPPSTTSTSSTSSTSTLPSSTTSSSTSSTTSTTPPSTIPASTTTTSTSLATSTSTTAPVSTTTSSTTPSTPTTSTSSTTVTSTTAGPTTTTTPQSCTTGADCDDGDPCDGIEACVDGTCLVARGAESSCRATDGFAVVTTFRRDQVAFCNLGSLTVDSTVDVGEAPWGVAWQPGGARVFVSNRDGRSVSVIDTATRTVVGTVKVGDQPLGIAVHPFQPRAYVANYDDDTVSVIDTTTLDVVDRIQVGNGPAGVAVHPAGAELYVTNYIEGSLSVVDVATGAVTATVKTGALPVGVAVHPSGAKIYVVCSKDRTVSVIGTVSHTVLDTVRVGRQPIGVAFNPDGSRAYVTNSADATVTIVDATVDRAIDKLSVGKSPLGVDVTETGAIWVAGSGADGMTVEGADGGEPSQLAVPGTPVAIGDFIGFAPGTCPTAPPRCDDGNPYTGDACVAGVGCDRTPITGVDAVRTGVDAVGEIVDAPENQADPLVAEIRAALPTLEAAVSAAQTDGSVAALRQVRRALTPVLRVLERARRQDALGTAGAHLLDIVREARRQLRRLARKG